GPRSSGALEGLNGALVLFGGRASLERAEVPPAPGARILLARVEPILAGLELADHDTVLLLRVVEDDAESVTRPAMDRAHAMTKRGAVPAARALQGTVAGGEDDELALLRRDRLAARLRARPLLDEQEVSAIVVDAA